MTPALRAPPPTADALSDSTKLALQALAAAPVPAVATPPPEAVPDVETAAASAAPDPDATTEGLPLRAPASTGSDAVAPPRPVAAASATMPRPRMPTHIEPERRRRSPWRLYGLAAGAVALLAVAVIALLVLRDPIIAGFPGAAEWYTRAGFGDGGLGAGLDIREVTTARRDGIDGGETLVVAGAVINIADGPRDVPRIRVGLVDDGDAELQAVLVSPERTALDPGERLNFTAVVERPASTVRKVKVTFAP